MTGLTRLRDLDVDWCELGLQFLDYLRPLHLLKALSYTGNEAIEPLNLADTLGLEFGVDTAWETIKTDEDYLSQNFYSDDWC